MRLLVLFLALFPSLLRAHDTGDSIRVRFGVDEACLSGVKAVDARIAFTLWIEEALHQLAIKARVEAMFLSDHRSMEKRLQAGELDLLLLNTAHYFPIRKRKDLDPLAVISATRKVGREYQLLAPKDVDLASLVATGGGRLLVHRGAGGDLPMAWLRKTFRDRGWTAPSRLFRDVEFPRKPSSCLIPVFFGQGAACVITRSDGETMAELNPQLRSSLHVLLRSEPIVETLICQTRDFGKRLDEQIHREHVVEAGPRFVKALELHGGRGVLLEVLTSIHRYPAGRQLMLLFRVERNLPYAEKDLEPTGRLLEGSP